ncbi:Sensor histidine kinase ResE [bioreactor metagenome]|uniref:histidine kinase n=1 Tax=bioreactor metagenome TaxID=1076179 RepID=A0A645JUY2_9ZZZZ
MTVELAEGLPRVTADSSGVLRVFTNLIRNALEHGNTRMAIRLYQDGAYIVSSFSNDVEGLTGEDILHVFDRFYTADKPRTGKSTGLGLAIVRELVGQMGHSVKAELEDGTFTVWVCWKPDA